jgi:hypothetical protein
MTGPALHTIKTIALAGGLCVSHLVAQPIAPAPWPATDALGRSLPLFQETGPVKKDRYVGIFYFIWLGAHSTTGPYDITQILKSKPPTFGPVETFHHWGKPELGYYYSRDPFVLRRHATQLTDAGVDFIALDVTNAFTYEREVKALCETWLQMRAEGNRTPQIIFLTNTKHVTTVNKLYNLYYKTGRYRDLWFIWQGKPLMMANPEGLSAQIRDSLTLRRSWAWTRKGEKWFGNGKDRWPWIDDTPQIPGWHTPGKPEQIPVAVAQHPMSNLGRSHQNGIQPPPGKERSLEGLYFQEQWNRALEVDPEVVFITGWNEWVAQRFLKEKNKAPGKLLDVTLKTGDTYFVDAYNMEFSRDIEPMEDGYGDAYYYQMIANIRKFKGSPPIPPSTGVQTFTDTSHDDAHRQHEGWAKQILTDDSGRNDIVRCDVETAENGLSFTITTRESLTTAADDRWMLLFIDADADPKTGWNGYDYVANRSRLGAGLASLEKLDRDGTTSPLPAVTTSASANRLTLVIPALPEWSGRTHFDFHISDNSPFNKNFHLYGDHAPNRRFNYRYSTP